MKTENFEELADFYDLIYKDKNYNAEVDFIESLFENMQGYRKILEIGCGTGNYTKILLNRGYEITGIDLSEAMLKVAKKKCNCRLINGDVRNFSINEKFDVCIAMFAVLGYVIENEDIVHVLKNVRNHLRENGLLIFDVWNGLAVLRNLPELRVKIAEDNETKVIRIANPAMRSANHVCEVNYDFVVLNKIEGTSKEFYEKHTVRFYFPQEIKFMLEAVGFKVLKICPFLNSTQRLDESVWNMTIVAKAL